MKNKIIICFLLLSLNYFGVTQNTCYNVLKFGAVNNGETISTKSIQKVIDHCAENGGGIVCFPAGKYISGTLFLKSFVTLHLESGAILKGSTNIGDYPVTISDVQATNTGNIGCSITGLPSNPATDITLSNIRIGFQGGGTKDLVSRQIEEFSEKYSDFKMFGMLPAYGFFCRRVDRLKLENIDLTYDLPDYRPALYFKDIKNSTIDNLNAHGEIGTESIIHIDNSQFIVIRECNLTSGLQLLPSIKNSSKT